jgi:hypothetical protein
MTETKQVADVDILKSLAEQKAKLPTLVIDGQTVAGDAVVAALVRASSISKISFISMLRWLSYSVGITLFLTVVFKWFGLVVATHAGPRELVAELLIRGDLLLISAGFAAEAIGNLLAASAASSTPKWMVGFTCILGLMASMILVSCCALVPSESLPSNLQQALLNNGTATQLKHIISLLSPIVFGITMLGVVISKFVVGEV